MIKIEAIEPDGWAQLRDIRLAGLQESPDAFGSTYAREREFDEATWRARLVSRATFFAVDVDSGRAIGVAGGYAAPDEPPDERYLVGMWVDPAYRGQGIAGRLIDVVVEWARAGGASILRLEVAVANPAARTAYLRAGFESTGEINALPRDPNLLEESMTLALGRPV